MTAIAALLIVTTACASSRETSNPDAGVPIFDGVCAPEFPDCQDTLVDDLFPNGEPDLFPDGESTDGALPGASAGALVGGGLTVVEALETSASGPLAVQGFYLDDGTGPRLCEALAESFPPQCGGASLSIGDMGDIDLGPLQSNQATTWSDAPVVIVGEVANGILNPTPMSL